VPPPATASSRLARWRDSFGGRLRTLREQRGLSQEALAERAGVDRKLIYRTELGQTSPRLDVVVQLADALDTDVTRLLPRSQRSRDT
jgi:transcriptional regulator with XRE-family HTH domain